MEPHHLVRRAAVTACERASNEVGIVADYSATESVLAVRHRSQGCPAVRLRIVAFVGGKILPRQLSAQDQDQPGIGYADNAARRRQWRSRIPLPRCGIIDVVTVHPLQRRSAPAADDVDLAL